MNTINTTKTSISLAVLAVITQISLNPANAQSTYGIDSWPSNWPAGTSIDSNNDVSETVPAGLSMRFGFRILAKKPRGGEQTISK